MSNTTNIKHGNWKGGITATCIDCGTPLSRNGYKRCQKHMAKSKEWLNNNSIAHKGINTWTKGRKLSETTKIKIGLSSVGEKNARWISDRSKLQRYSNENKDRRSSMYRNWRYKVKQRDNFECKIKNNDCVGRLEVHHILGYTEHPKLRYEINNGITLCHAHHPRKKLEELLLIPYFKELVEEERLSAF